MSAITERSALCCLGLRPPRASASRKNRERMHVLKRRAAFLEARLAVKGDHLSFDRHELSSLKWAIGELEQLYPALAEVEYKGDNHLLDAEGAETPVQRKTETAQ
jgi:hypothetical protein